MNTGDLPWLVLLQHQLDVVRGEVSLVGQLDIAIAMVDSKLRQVAEQELKELRDRYG